MHCHRKARQFFYILSGEAVMKLSDSEIVIYAGEGHSVSEKNTEKIFGVSNR